MCQHRLFIQTGVNSSGSLPLVDDHGHTSLAMRPLTAVEPQRARVIDKHRVGGDLTQLLARSYGLEA